MVALLCLSTYVIVMWLFLTVSWVGLRCVIVVFPDHTYLFDFVKSHAEIKEDKICLFTKLHILASSSMSMMSCVSQDLFFLNPCCSSKRIFCSVKCLEYQTPQHAQALYRGNRSGILVGN